MDGIRESFSRLKKDVKHRMRGRKNKPDRKRVDAAGERVDSSGSLLRPGSRIAASGNDGEGSTDGRQVRSRDRSPQPEPILVGGSDDDGQGSETNVDGKEVGQVDPRLDPGVEVAVGSRPSQEVEQVYPSPNAPSIPPGGPDSV